MFGVVRQSSSAKELVKKQSSKDETKGTFHESNGKVNERVGQATNNPNLEVDGHDEKIAGKVQRKLGKPTRS
jgi:uncharacterized protein YjbJ (UPF0337 family)